MAGDTTGQVSPPKANMAKYYIPHHSSLYPSWNRMDCPWKWYTRTSMLGRARLRMRKQWKQIKPWLGSELCRQAEEGWRLTRAPFHPSLRERTTWGRTRRSLHSRSEEHSLETGRFTHDGIRIEKNQEKPNPTMVYWKIHEGETWPPETETTTRNMTGS